MSVIDGKAFAKAVTATAEWRSQPGNMVFSWEQFRVFLAIYEAAKASDQLDAWVIEELKNIAELKPSNHSHLEMARAFGTATGIARGVLETLQVESSTRKRESISRYDVQPGDPNFDGAAAFEQHLKDKNEILVKRLAMMCRRLADALNRNPEGKRLAENAWQFLAKHNLQGSPLRGSKNEQLSPLEDHAKNALEICRILANTPPEEWLSKKRIHEELQEFRHPWDKI